MRRNSPPRRCEPEDVAVVGCDLLEDFADFFGDFAAVFFAAFTAFFGAAFFTLGLAAFFFFVEAT